MGNFLKKSNEKLLPKAAIVGAIGAVTMNMVGCGPTTEAQADKTIVCSGTQVVTAERGNTMSGMVREHSAEPNFSSADIHNTVVGLDRIDWWNKANNVESVTSGDLDIIEINPAELPAHNSSRLPGVTAGESYVVPEVCYLNQPANK